MHNVTLKIGSQEFTFQSGLMAKQANGSVLGSVGETTVLATVCSSAEDRPELDYLPLQVEYNEKYYAAGKIPGGFFKREGRPKEREILVSRLIDRPLRPLFPKTIRRDIQVIPTVLSSDTVNHPDILAINTASAAVVISDVPFDGPIGAVRVAYCDNKLVINPTASELEKSTLDIVVTGTAEGVTMVEGGAQEISEEILLEAIELARKPISDLCDIQRSLKDMCGKEKFSIANEAALKDRYENYNNILATTQPKMETACFVKGKHNRSHAIAELKREITSSLGEEADETEIKMIHELLEETESNVVRDSILHKKIRTDGRKPDEIRTITTDIAVLPRTHGSALFTRGETQSLSVVTLGTVYDEQIKDDITGDRRESFMLHYNFPPFSVGETGRLATGRREIGHGELANRAIRAVAPTKTKFPYTIRLVSEILESNGSSSMATVCAGSLSLMDAGVPIKKAVAGIAMGLVTDGETHVILSDILGEEDHLGDMDFKVAGTADGITAFQMDIKVKNVDAAIMKDALSQAKAGRMHILSEMAKTIAQPKQTLSEIAPRIITFKVDTEHLGTLIGPGGKTIKSVNEKYSVTTNIEDDGTITIFSPQQQDGQLAKEAFLKLLEEPEVGKIYDGTVKRIVDFGAFIEFLAGKEGLCHISRMSETRINTVSEVLKMNQSIRVKIIEIDKMGRVNLCLLDEQGAPIGKSAAQGSSQRRYGSGSYSDNNSKYRNDNKHRGDNQHRNRSDSRRDHRRN